MFYKYLKNALKKNYNQLVIMLQNLNSLKYGSSSSRNREILSDKQKEGRLICNKKKLYFDSFVSLYL